MAIDFELNPNSASAFNQPQATGSALGAFGVGVDTSACISACRFLSAV
jgi:hypothetical protein